ncbi:UNVERIFIED_CONTAM: hypothetical protein Slati_2880700 [Sesamum latifolium]|uniref:Uncharacterized protein n=1 Tax=Sesamum latifolium TaxID=2727402 RepID=A0AAW2VBF1_9LAMI
MIEYPSGVIEYCPPDHTMPGDYYNTKKLIKDLGLPVEKIGACKNGACCIGRTTSIWSTANFVGTLGTSRPEGRVHA